MTAESAAAAEQHILDASVAALRRIKSCQTWTDWLAIAEAVRVITDNVKAATGTDNLSADAFKKAFGPAWRKHESLVSNEPDARPITRQEIHDLRFLLNHPEVTAWRAKLTPERQRSMLHPRTAINHWKAAMKREQAAAQRAAEPAAPAAAAKPEPRDPAALASAQSEIERLRKRVAELEAAAKAAPPSPAQGPAVPFKDLTKLSRDKLEIEAFRARVEIDRLNWQLREAHDEVRRSDTERVATLRATIAGLEQAQARRDAAAKAQKTKAAAAAKALAEGGDGDDPRLVAMAKANNDLRAKIKAMREDTKATNGRMSHKTLGLISKALHSDGGMPTRQELDDAMKALNGWKADNKAAAQRTR